MPGRDAHRQGRRTSGGRHRDVQDKRSGVFIRLYSRRNGLFIMCALSVAMAVAGKSGGGRPYNSRKGLLFKFFLETYWIKGVWVFISP